MHKGFFKIYWFSFRKRFLAGIMVSMMLAACRQDMHDQPKYRPQRPIDQIGSINDGTSARPQVEGTVAIDQLRDNVEFNTGKLRNAQATGTGTAPSQAPTVSTANTAANPQNAQ